MTIPEIEERKAALRKEYTAIHSTAVLTGENERRIDEILIEIGGLERERLRQVSIFMELKR
jgi:hypothetical protein